MQSEPLPLDEYKLHVQRLYDAVEHLFSWLKRISLAKQEPPGAWIQNFLDDVIEISERNQPVQRIENMRQQFDIDGFAFRVTRVEDTMIRVNTTILIGLYFPPEYYPPADGKFPSITIRIGFVVISIIQLDGTNQLYKPFGEFWLHNNISGILICSIDTVGRPYYTVEITDSVKIEETTMALRTVHKDRGLIYLHGKIALETINHPTTYSRLCMEETVLSYPYVRAANIIKRAWTRYRHRQRLRCVNLELAAVPGLGVDALQLQDKYANGFKFD